MPRGLIDWRMSDDVDRHFSCSNRGDSALHGLSVYLSAGPQLITPPIEDGQAELTY